LDEANAWLVGGQRLASLGYTHELAVQ